MHEIRVTLVIRIDVVEDLSKGLVDVLHVVIRFEGKHSIGVDLTLVHPADDRPPVQPALCQQHGIGRRIDPAGLSGIIVELRQRQPGRHIGIQPIGDGLEI